MAPRAGGSFSGVGRAVAMGDETEVREVLALGLSFTCLVILIVCEGVHPEKWSS